MSSLTVYHCLSSTDLVLHYPLVTWLDDSQNVVRCIDKISYDYNRTSYSKYSFKSTKWNVIYAHGINALSSKV